MDKCIYYGIKQNWYLKEGSKFLMYKWDNRIKIMQVKYYENELKQYKFYNYILKAK